MSNWLDIAALVLTLSLAILGIWNRARIVSAERQIQKVECIEQKLVKLCIDISAMKKDIEWLKNEQTDRRPQ